MISLDPVIEKIFNQATAAGASDIHLEPTRRGLFLRCRVAGQMQDCFGLPEEITEALVARLKLMSGCDSTLGNKPQDGAFVWQGVETRSSFIPVLGGQSIVLRLLQRVDELSKLEGLGFGPQQLQQVHANIQPGLVLIVGPTGSGKTTTFYATLRSLDADKNKIITVEDPVEQHLEGVCQVPVSDKMTFAQALRSILRQSPDVIGVGELRDSESVAMALQAALTGHIVVATVHAGSLAEVPSRLIEMGANPRILAQVLRLMISQRLINFKATPTSIRRAIFAVGVTSDQLSGAVRAGGAPLKMLEALQAQGVQPLRNQARTWVDKGQIELGEFLAEFGAGE